MDIKSLEKMEELLDAQIEDELEEELEDMLEIDEVDEKNDVVRVADFKENAIEWYNGNDIITVTLSQRRFINKINRLAKLYPNEVKIDKVNNEGTILAHIPLSYLKFQRPRTMTEEEKNIARERLAKYRKK